MLEPDSLAWDQHRVHFVENIPSHGSKSIDSAYLVLYPQYNLRQCTHTSVDLFPDVANALKEDWLLYGHMGGGQMLESGVECIGKGLARGSVPFCFVAKGEEFRPVREVQVVAKILEEWILVERLGYAFS